MIRNFILGLYVFVISSSAFSQTNINESLLSAVKQNDKTKIFELVEKGANVNLIDKNGAPLIMWAAYKSDLETVKLLIKNGADYSKKGPIYFNGEEQKTTFYGLLLGIAVANKNMDLIEYLLEELRVDINEVEYVPPSSNLGWTALDWSVYVNDDKIITYLINHGAIPKLETYGVIIMNLKSKGVNYVFEKINWMNAILKKNETLNDELKVFSHMVKSEALTSIKDINEALNELNTIDSITRTDDVLKDKYLGFILYQKANAHMLNDNYDDAIKAFKDFLIEKPIQYNLLTRHYNTFVYGAKHYIETYIELKKAYTNIGKYEDWKEYEETFQNELKKDIRSYLKFNYLLLDTKSKSLNKKEEISVLNRILNHFEEDNEYFAYASQLKTAKHFSDYKSIDTTTIKNLTSFLNKYPSHYHDNKFMSTVIEVYQFAGVMYFLEDKFDIATDYFEKSFDYSYEFSKDSLLVSKTDLDLYSCQTHYKLSSKKEDLAKPFADQLINEAKVNKNNTLQGGKIDFPTFQKNTFESIKKKLKRSEALLYFNPKLSGIFADNKKNKSFIYLITSKSKAPIRISTNYDVENNTLILKKYNWEDISDNLPKSINKLYLLSPQIKGLHVDELISNNQTSNNYEHFILSSLTSFINKNH